MADNFYAFQAKNVKGEPQDLKQYEGQVSLVVNVASKCGYTPQYEGLEQLYKSYHEKGFEIIAFPCNQFGNQEPGTDQEVQQFCKLNYGVTFPVMAKIDVNGDNTDPIYKWLKSHAPGLLGTEAIKWNFTKFLINKKGQVIERYAPTTKPSELIGPIEKALAEK